MCIDSPGARRNATTSSFGLYSFDNVAPGQNYTVAVSSRHFRFVSRQIQLNAPIADADFMGLE